MPLGTPYIPDLVPTAQGNQVSNVPAATAAAAMTNAHTPDAYGALSVGAHVVTLNKDIPIALDTALSKALDPSFRLVAVGTIAAQAATQDVAFTYTMPTTAFNNDEVPVVYSATKGNGDALPAWVTFNATTRVLAGTPLVGDVGTLAVKITATSPAGETASHTFNVVVAAA